jgi:HAD superfamily hydrolase (TIGR01549 family)
MKPIRAVFFDLDGTLLHSRPPSIEMFYQVVSSFGLELSHEQRRMGRRWAHWYWAESDDLHADLEFFGGTYESAEFWARHAWRHLTSIGVDDERARQLGPVVTQELRQQEQPQKYVPDDARETLAVLESQEVFLGLVSNRRKPLHEVAARHEMEHHFDLLLAAGEVGAWKPDPGLLQVAAERLNVEPSESIYVGDNYFADVIAAEAAGMQPLLFDPDHLFDEAQCPILERIGQVLDFLTENPTAF